MSDLISRDAVMLRVREFIGNPTYDELMLVNDLNAIPSAEPEIIRCKDCKHYNAGFECLIEGYGIERNGEWYCGDAERRRTEEPDNEVHLCDFCKYDYPECPTKCSDVIFGNGMGHDNICACAKFEIKQEQASKAEMLEEPFRTSMTWEGKCSNCGCYTIHEMNYCFGCGAKLYWGE